MEYSNMSCLEIVNVLKYKSDKEKTAILGTPVIKDKFKKELLKEAAMGNAYYNFRNIINVLSLNYIFDNFDYDNRNYITAQSRAFRPWERSFLWEKSLPSGAAQGAEKVCFPAFWQKP